ncbi:MAG: DUF4358 domain-containing protein [Bacteroides sp.]|nr:DUF4358 domain-containing protein [Bacteroides sp.]
MAGAILLSLASCSESGDPAPAATDATETTVAENAPVGEGDDAFLFVPSDFSVSEVTAAILADVPISSAVEKGVDDLEYYFDGLDPSGITDASYCMCASGAYPDELAVIKFESAALAEAGEDAVKKRLESQRATYESYTPEEMYKFDGSIAEARGDYVVYLITADNAAAKDVLARYIPA